MSLTGETTSKQHFLTRKALWVKFKLVSFVDLLQFQWSLVEGGIRWLFLVVGPLLQKRKSRKILSGIWDLDLGMFQRKETFRLMPLLCLTVVFMAHIGIWLSQLTTWQNTYFKIPVTELRSLLLESSFCWIWSMQWHNALVLFSVLMKTKLSFYKSLLISLLFNEC
jgi:hypothetical protein